MCASTVIDGSAFNFAHGRIARRGGRILRCAQNDRSESLSRRRAEDEVVADACQTMLRDSKALQEFAEQKPEAAKGVIRWLADWFKKIKAAFSRSAQLSEQARFMEKLEKDVREAFGKLWDDALREAVRVHDEIGNMESPATEGGEQNMDRSYAEQVDDVLANTHDPNNHVNMGRTPVRLSNILGLPKIPMLATSNHIYTITVSAAKAQQDGRFNRRSHYHDLGRDTTVALPSLLNAPVLILKSNQDRTSAEFVVVTNQLDQNKDPIIAALKPGGKGNYWNIEFLDNAFLSGYGKENFRDYIARAKTENRILYANKNSQRDQDTTGHLLSNNILLADYTHNLSQFKQIVNQKFAGTMFQNNSGDKYTQFSERDYDTPSDLELLMNADESAAKNTNQLGLLKDYKALGKRAEILQKRLDALMQEKANREASGKEYKEGYLKIKESEIAKLEREIAAIHTAMEKKMLTPQLFKLLEAERDAAAKVAVERKEEVFQRYKERKQETAIRNRIANLKGELQRRLTNPTDRSYVPAELAAHLE